jgi:septum formation protein
MIENIKNRRIILASKSPRRTELLKGLGLEFISKTKNVEEDFPEEMDVFQVPRFLAEKKALAFQADLDDKDLLITADTVVIVNGEILNKPTDKKEALSMLQKLSGNIHQVVTGVCIMDHQKTLLFDEQTEVHFKELEEEELLAYIDQFQPFDKAGAYGVQEWIGYVGVYKIIGSFYNVMGLPVHRIYEELKKW